ncbi:MAG: O-antigen ligase family protein [Sphingobacteriia bacterium]|nr:O-antigen ligase family protein [Sphingobacteriia bacterium]
MEIEFDNRAQRLTRTSLEICLMLMVFTMPWAPKFTILFTILSFVVVIVSHFFFKTEPFNKKRVSLFFMLVGFYLLHFIGILYSDDSKSAWFDIEIKMTLLLSPLFFLFANSRLITLITIKRVVGMFVLGLFLMVLWRWTIIGIDVIDTGIYDKLFYKSLAGEQHPTYLSLYLVFAIAVLIFNHLPDAVINIKHYLKIRLLILFLFGLFLVMLSSRAALLSSVGLAILIILFDRRNKPVERFSTGCWYGSLVAGSRAQIGRFKSVNSPYLDVVVALGIPFLLISLMRPVAVNRFAQIENVITNDTTIARAVSEESTVQRMMILKSSLKVIKSTWMTGVGTGDIHDALERQFLADHANYSAQQNYNPHDQYLQTMIGLGLPGLLLLLIMLYGPLLYLRERINLVYLSFILVFGFNLLFESMLERQAGVLFYALFNPLFLAAMLNYKRG